MDQILSEIVNWYRGDVMTQERCDTLIRDIKQALTDFEELEETRDFFAGQPIPTDD